MLTKKHVFGAVMAVAVVTMTILVVLGITGVLLPPPDITTLPPHEICDGNLPDYLQEIGAKPVDFDFVFKKGNINFCELEEAYYIQPDFYADSWVEGKRYYEAHDYSRWLVYGHGAYPAYPKTAFSSNKVGEEVQICTLYRTGWGVETHQGLKLIPEKNEYFEVVIDPNEFLLQPTFPDFDRGWVKKLNITVKVKQTPSAGTYNIVVNAINPSEEKREEWKSEVLKKNISIERMLKECIKQKEEKELNLKCEELIKDRRNKYVDISNINMGARFTIMIIVEGEKG